MTVPFTSSSTNGHLMDGNEMDAVKKNRSHSFTAPPLLPSSHVAARSPYCRSQSIDGKCDGVDRGSRPLPLRRSHSMSDLLPSTRSSMPDSIFDLGTKHLL